MTPDDVMAAWKRYFVRDNRVVGTFIPDNNPQRAQMTPAPTLDEVISAYKFKEQGHKAEAFDSTPANLNARTERFAIGDVQVALLPKRRVVKQSLFARNLDTATCNREATNVRLPL